MCFRPSSAGFDKKCPKCGSSYEADAHLCPKCGAEILNASVPGMLGVPGSPTAPSAPGAPAVPGAPKAPGVPAR